MGSKNPDPAVGQVWEDGYGGSYAGRRVEIISLWPEVDAERAPDDRTWSCRVVAYPKHPRKVGSVTYLSGRTLRTKWLFVEAGGRS